MWKVRAFRTLMDFLALLIVFWVCLPKLSLGSKVSPRILGSFMVGRGVLFIVRESVVLYSAGSGVNSVVVVLEALSVSWFWIVQLCMCSRYGWIMFCAV